MVGDHKAGSHPHSARTLHHRSPSIYTGFLFAMLGVALIVGEIRGLLGVGVLFLSLWLKSRMEEQFMLGSSAQTIAAIRSGSRH